MCGIVGRLPDHHEDDKVGDDDDDKVRWQCTSSQSGRDSVPSQQPHF